MSKKYINEILQGLSLTFGVFLLAFCHNTLLLPHNLVAGGMSGLSIIVQTVFGLNATTFIYVSTLLLLLISYVMLGKEVTYATIVGLVLYPLMVTFTAPLAKFILARSDLNEMVVIVFLAGLLYGVAHGTIYKMGFSTGGGDVIMQVMSKYGKISETRANIIYNLIIIILSGFIFGISSFIYSTIILALSTLIIEKMIVGISNSKVFFISTKKPEEIKKLIHLEYESGLTLIPTKSTIFHKKGELILVVIPNREYYNFKNRILEIDSEAFFIINDCYEVAGGKRHRNLTFLE